MVRWKQTNEYSNGRSKVCWTNQKDQVVHIEEVEYEQEENNEENRLNNLIEKYADSDIKGNFLVYQIYFYDPLEDM